MARTFVESLWIVQTTALALVVCCAFAGCARLNVNTLADRIAPSNDRPWSPELATLPYADIDLQSGQIDVHNIRNCQYVTKEDFVVDHYDRSIHLDQIESVDFIVVPFQNAPMLAHTMLSFGLDDGSYLSVSIEIRTEKGETYSPLAGTNRRFELTYVVADERDVIRVRTRHRGDDVYVYPPSRMPSSQESCFWMS